MDRAVFLDRDGTVNEDAGDICEIEKLVFIPGAIEALKILQKRFILFIITNQSGIGKGLFSHEDYVWFSEYFSNCLRDRGIEIKEIMHCPHTKEQSCSCRKPSPYFIKMLCGRYSIDIKRSFCIGDHPHDIEMAHNAGTRSVYLLTGHGQKHREELSAKPDHIEQDLYRAALKIEEVY